MKNVLMIIVSLVVGYSFAYMSASKEWPPFGKKGDQKAPYSKTMVSENNSDSGKVMAVEVTAAEMKAMSDNYAAWITGLTEQATKGNTMKKSTMQVVTRGGRISAALIERLAKSNQDIYYIFGKKVNSHLTYMILTEPAKSTTEVFDDRYCLAADSATMCPCVCPTALKVDMPPYCYEPKLPPTLPPVETP